MYIFYSFSSICFPWTNKALYLFKREKKQEADCLSGSFCIVLLIEVNCFGKDKN